MLLGALRLAFENEATLTLGKEAATLPARTFVSEGQAGFLVGFLEGHETGVQKAAASRGLEMTLLGTLARRTQTSTPSQSQDERLRTAWQNGLEPFFSAPV